MSEQEKDFLNRRWRTVPLASGRQTLYLKPQEAVDKSARREAQRLLQENFLSTDFRGDPCEQPLEFKGKAFNRACWTSCATGVTRRRRR